MTIVMGLDQHRAQITAEWIDTVDRRGRRASASRRPTAPACGGSPPASAASSSRSRWRRRPAGGSSSRSCSGRCAGASGRAGRDRGASRDQEARQERSRRRAPPARAADGRPAAGVVDPARASARPARPGQAAAHARRARREWQQRMQAVLYHHGVPSRSWLISAESRAWLGELELPAAAREQITIALAMIDAHDTQLVPLDQQLREYARRQPGCRALMRHYGIGPLTSITILAELGDARRFSSSREAVRYAGLDITVHQSDARRAPGHLSRQGPAGAALGALRSRPMRPPARLTRPRTTTCRRPSGSAATAPAWPSRASCSSAATTRCANSARRPCSPHDHSVRARSPHSRRCTAAGSRHAPAATTGWTAFIDRAAAPRHGTPHHPSCRRPGATPDRGPR